MKIKHLLVLLFVTLLSIKATGQTNTVQPSIMVIPFVKEGEDIRRTLDMSNEKRQVLAKVTEAFADKGFQTKDFNQNFKNVSQRVALNEGSQSDIKTAIIQNSGADIFVEADVAINKQSDGNSVRVTLKACDASTSKVLSSKIGDSGKFYTSDIGKLGSKAVEKAMDGFLATMQQSFDDIRNNGRSIIVEITFDEASDFDAFSEVGSDGDEFRDLIDDWMKANAYKNYAHSQGVTQKMIIYDDVRIPIYDANGNNYDINEFGRQLRRYLKKNGITISDSLVGGTLAIKVN